MAVIGQEDKKAFDPLYPIHYSRPHFYFYTFACEPSLDKALDRSQS